MTWTTCEQRFDRSYGFVKMVAVRFLLTTYSAWSSVKPVLRPNSNEDRPFCDFSTSCGHTWLDHNHPNVLKEPLQAFDAHPHIVQPLAAKHCCAPVHFLCPPLASPLCGQTVSDAASQNSTLTAAYWIMLVPPCTHARTQMCAYTQK